MTYGEVEVKLYTLLISALAGDDRPVLSSTANETSELWNPAEVGNMALKRWNSTTSLYDVTIQKNITRTFITVENSYLEISAV
jgi:hypothetical protein